MSYLTDAEKAKREDLKQAYIHAVNNGEDVAARAYAGAISRMDAQGDRPFENKTLSNIADAVTLPIGRLATALGKSGNDPLYETSAKRLETIERRHEDAGWGNKLLTGVLDAPRQIYGGIQHGRNMANAGIDQLLEKPLSWMGMGGDQIKSPITGKTYNETQNEKLQQGDEFVQNNSWMANAGQVLGQGRDAIAMGPIRGAGLAANTAVQSGIAALETPGDGLDRGISAAFAGGGNVLGAGAASAFSHLAKPVQNISEAARRLIAEGVYPTPGAAKGEGVWKSIEDKLTSVPFVGDFISEGRRQAIREFNAAALRRSNTGVQGIGQPAVGQIDSAFGTRYANAQAPLSFDMNDPAFLASMSGALRNNYANGNAINNVTDSINNFRVSHNHAPLRHDTTQGFHVPNPPVPLIGTGANPAFVAGDSVTGLRNYLRTEASAYAKSTDPLTSKAAPVFRDTLEALDDGLTTQGHNSHLDLARFNTVNSDYAAYKPAQLASMSPTAANKRAGVFTPGEYASAIRSNSIKNKTEAQLRRGTLPGQSLSNDANEVLGNIYNDSGSAGRMGLSALALGGGTLMTPWTIPLMAHSALTATQTGRRYALGALYPQAQHQIADALRHSAPYAGFAMGQGMGFWDPRYSPIKPE